MLEHDPQTPSIGVDQRGFQYFPSGITWTKRLLDLGLTAVGLVLISPILLMVALLVRWKLGRPVLYKQMRPGYQGQLFALYKFRTMTDARDPHGALLPDGQRLSSLGRYLRAFSLDELPELFNVLRGEMSLVGPRPLLVQYLERYSPEQARRHEVRPGITGWAQVNGRNTLTWADKFAFDVWYVDHWSLNLDLKILGLTLWKVLKREGINQPGHATAEEFTGQENRQD
jgi:sugar transferase EpsL